MPEENAETNISQENIEEQPEAAQQEPDRLEPQPGEEANIEETPEENVETNISQENPADQPEPEQEQSELQPCEESDTEETPIENEETDISPEGAIEPTGSQENEEINKEEANENGEQAESSLEKPKMPVNGTKVMDIQPGEMSKLKKVEPPPEQPLPLEEKHYDSFQRALFDKLKDRSEDLENHPETIANHPQKKPSELDKLEAQIEKMITDKKKNDVHSSHEVM